MVEKEINIEELQAARAMATPESIITGLDIVTVPLLLHGEHIPYEPPQSNEWYSYYARFKGGKHEVDNPDKALKRLDSKAKRVKTIPPLQRIVTEDYSVFMERGNWSVAWKYVEKAKEAHPNLDVNQYLIEAGSRTVYEWCRTGLFVMQGLGLPDEKRFFNADSLAEIFFDVEKLAAYDPEEATDKKVLVTQMIYQYSLKNPYDSIYKLGDYYRSKDIKSLSHLSDEQVDVIGRAYHAAGTEALDNGKLKRVNDLIKVLYGAGLVTDEQVIAWINGLADDATIDFFVKEDSPFHSDKQFANPWWNLEYILSDWHGKEAQAARERLLLRAQKIRAVQLASLVEDPGQLLAHEVFGRRLVLAADGLNESNGLRSKEGYEDPPEADFLEILLDTLAEGDVAKISSNQFSEHFWPRILYSLDNPNMTREQALDTIARVFSAISEGAVTHGLRRPYKQTFNILMSLEYSEAEADIFWSLVDEKMVIGHIEELINYTAYSDEERAEIEALDKDDEAARKRFSKLASEDYYKDNLRQLLEFFKMSPRNWYRKHFVPWQQEEQRQLEKLHEQMERWEKRQARKAAKQASKVQA